METENINASQLYIAEDNTIQEEPIADTLDAIRVDYKKLDKVDLTRLCKEKDATLKKYEEERRTLADSYNKEIENMNNYYIAKVNELKALIKYYERKFDIIKDLINIEKGGENNDTIQRTTKGQA